MLGVNYNWKALWSARFGLMYYNSSSLFYLEKKEQVVQNDEVFTPVLKEDY